MQVVKQHQRDTNIKLEAVNSRADRFATYCPQAVDNTQAVVTLEIIC